MGSRQVPDRQGERILVVDDTTDTREVLDRQLSSHGYSVVTARSAEEAVEILGKNRYSLLITDFRMPGAGGLELIRYVRENLKHTEIIMMTGFATVPGAVKAIKAGAEEYLSKPFTEEELLAAVRRVLGKRRNRRSADPKGPAPEAAYPGLFGSSKAMAPVFRAISKAAATSATVLVTGESGTGKELVARAIHYTSARARAPFVAVNCGGIPENLLESELFGHVKGAFTGADDTRTGFFQTAEGGTIFLDEVSEASLALQVRLLRTLQEREIAMVGSRKTQTVDVRVISATNKDLAGLVHQGAFREDLYFRLHVIPIALPPLREREEDIPLLAGHFLERFAKEYSRPGLRFSEGALDVLSGYPWPGNVRELENVVQQVAVLSEDDVIEVADFPPHMRFSLTAPKGRVRRLAEVEADYVRWALETVKGNKTEAARLLGIDRKTLREMLSRARRGD